MGQENLEVDISLPAKDPDKRPRRSVNRRYAMALVTMAVLIMLVPVGLLLGAGAAVFFLVGHQDNPWASRLTTMALKLGVFGLAIALIVPVSVYLSDMIEATYEEASSSSLRQTTQEIESSAGQVQDGAENSSTESDTESDSDSNGGGILSTLGNTVAQVGDAVNEGLTSLTQVGQEALTGLQNAMARAMEAFAVMIVTSCVIPLLVMLFFFWLTKTITGLDLQIPHFPKPSATGRTPGNAIKTIRNK